jgi:predicted Zn-dependent protease
MDAALRSFEQMLRDYPDTPYLHYEYGLALAAASHFEQADTQLRQEILIAPHSAIAYKALAQALQSQGKSEKAANASRVALELAKQPTNVDATQITRYALARGAEVARSSADNLPATATRSTSATEGFEDKARLAETARRDGRIVEASLLYQSALQLHPDWQEGWRQLGTLAYMQGRYPEAISALQQSVALDSKQPDTWTLLGLSEFETKDYKNSLIHLEHGRAMGFSGNSAAVRVSRYHLALLLNLDGNFDRAIGLLISEVDPGALSEEIQFAMGIALLRIPALPEQVDAAVRPLVTEAGEAAVLLSQSYYDKAFPIFDKMVREHPATPFLHYAYGDALAWASQYDEAQTQLKEETRVNPSSEIAYIRLASIGLLLHDSVSALADAKKAIALAPESAEAHYVLGRAFLEEGDSAASIRELEAARRFAPNSPKVHFNLARAYAQANRTAEAQQERAEFERLNAQMPGQSGSYGDRAARGSAADASMQPLPK